MLNSHDPLEIVCVTFSGTITSQRNRFHAIAHRIAQPNAVILNLPCRFLGKDKLDRRWYFSALWTSKWLVSGGTLLGYVPNLPCSTSLAARTVSSLSTIEYDTRR